MFIHFTSAAAAEAIVAEMVLRLSATITGAVYAVAVGGADVPCVQYGGGRGVTGDPGRQVAVLFTTSVHPDTMFPEEVIWHRDDPLPLAEAMVISAVEAAAALDGSAGIPDDGLFWPEHLVRRTGAVPAA